MQAALAFVEGGLACEYEDLTECPNYRAMVAERIGPSIR
jgi:hypothetical protein